MIRRKDALSLLDFTLGCLDALLHLRPVGFKQGHSVRVLSAKWVRHTEPPRRSSKGGQKRVMVRLDCPLPLLACYRRGCMVRTEDIC